VQPRGTAKPSSPALQDADKTRSSAAGREMRRLKRHNHLQGRARAPNRRVTPALHVAFNSTLVDSRDRVNPWSRRAGVEPAGRRLGRSAQPSPPPHALAHVRAIRSTTRRPGGTPYAARPSPRNWELRISKGRIVGRGRSSTGHLRGLGPRNPKLREEKPVGSCRPGCDPHSPLSPLHGSQPVARMMTALVRSHVR